MRSRPAAVRVATLLVFILSVPSVVAADVLRLEPSSCKVAFRLGATFHHVEGIFAMKGGEIVFDPSTGAASGRVVIAADSGSTKNTKRDRKMQREVLESTRYPEIVFLPDRLEGTFREEGDSEVQLLGTIEIHGDSHNLVIAAKIHVDGGRLTGTAQFTVPFVEWGMKDPSVFMLRVKKEVQVTLDLTGSVGGESPPAETSAKPD